MTRMNSAIVFLLILLPLAGCREEPPPVTSQAKTPAPPPAAEPPPPVLLPPASLVLDYGFTLGHIDAGDLDGDGRLDLTLASHVEGRIETFYQQPERRFSASGALADPGFHPNGTLTMTGGDGGRYLILNAETLNLARAYRAVPGAPAQRVGDTPVQAPFASIGVGWPDWGQVLAIISKAGGKLQLMPGFDPALALAAEPVFVTVTPKAHLRLRGLTAADIAGQGVPALLVAVPKEGLIAAISPEGPRQVRVDKLADLGRLAGPEVILPGDYNRDGHLDLVVLGQLLAEAVLLRNNGQGAFTEQRIPLGDPARYPGVRGGAVTRDADGTLLVWASLDQALGVLRWGPDASAAPEPTILTRSGNDPIRFATGDLDADGHQDLVMGSSVGSLPITVIFGPLAPKVAAIGTMLEGLAARQASLEQGSMQQWNLLDQK